MWLDEHLRHGRGYGVHSPFLYRIVREAMMPRGVMEGDTTLFDALRSKGVGRRTATRLHNLHVVENYKVWGIDECKGGGLMVATPECEESRVGEMIRTLGEQGGALCVLHPVGNRPRRELCRRLVAEHNSMSASKVGFTLFFSRHDLRKQHITL